MKNNITKTLLITATVGVAAFFGNRLENTVNTALASQTNQSNIVTENNGQYCSAENDEIFVGCNSFF